MVMSYPLETKSSDFGFNFGNELSVIWGTSYLSGTQANELIGLDYLSSKVSSNCKVLKFEDYFKRLEKNKKLFWLLILVIIGIVGLPIPLLSFHLLFSGCSRFLMLKLSTQSRSFISYTLILEKLFCLLIDTNFKFDRKM